jgi:type II secretory pathway pseudopilin PulG
VRRLRSLPKSGFTVLEALIALVIIGFTVVTTVEALGGGLRAERQVSRHLEAVALAESRLNELGVLPRDSIAYYAGGRDGVFAPPFESYRWRATIEPVAGSRSLVRADVTVSWQGGSYALQTLFHRPPEIAQR